MKIPLTIWFLVVFCWSCSNRDKEADFSYIKVMTERLADSVTRYNKGFTTGTFLYYEPKKDSLLIFLSTVDTPNVEKTYVGSLINRRDVDSFRNLLRVLRRFGNGDLPLPFDSLSHYDGPYFYVEYQDGRGLHNNSFILENDTLNQFSKFYYRLLDLARNHGKTGLHLISRDSVFVMLTDRTGNYQNVETPYIPLPCKTEVDFKNLYGEWRSANTDYPYSKEKSYTKMIFQRNGIWIWQKIENGLLTKGDTTNFIINPKAKTFTLWKKGRTRTLTHQVVNLSSTCLQYLTKAYKETYDITMRYDRM
jgi:hypothetical protein